MAYDPTKDPEYEEALGVTPAPAAPVPAPVEPAPNYADVGADVDQGAFRKGIRAGMQDVVGGYYALKGLAQDKILQDEEGAEESLREATPYFEEADEIAPEMKTFGEMETMQDFTDTILGTAGRMMPDLLATGASAVASGGSALAARGAAAVAQGVAKKAAVKQAARIAGKLTPGVGKAAVAGAVGGTAAGQAAELGRNLTTPEARAEWEENARIRRLTQAREAPDAAGIAKVIDGDTVHILDDAGKVIERIRPAGINAADKDQAGYAEATEVMRRLVDGKRISVVGSKLDAFGRRLGHIFTDDSDESASERLLKGGQVAAANQFVSAMPSYFRQLETEGRGAEGALPLFSGRRAMSEFTPETLAGRAEAGAPVERTAGDDGEARSLEEMSRPVAAGVAFNTALDILPQLRVARKFLPGQVAKDLATKPTRQVAKEITKGAVAEGATEGVQTIVERAVAAEIDRSKEVFGEGSADEIFTAATLGAIFGAGAGALGAAPEVVRTARARRAAGPASAPIQTVAPTATPQTGAGAPPPATGAPPAAGAGTPLQSGTAPAPPTTGPPPKAKPEAGQAVPTRVATGGKAAPRGTTKGGPSNAPIANPVHETADGSHALRADAVKQWAQGKGAILLQSDDGAKVMLSSGGTEGVAMYTPGSGPNKGKAMRIPSAGIVAEIANNPTEAKVESVFRAAIRAEVNAQADKTTKAYTWDAASPDKLATETSAYERVHPMYEEYGVTPVSVKPSRERADVETLGEKPEQYAHALKAATAAMQKEGLAPMGVYGNKIYYATPEQRDAFYRDYQIDADIPGDINVMKRVGTILKRPGGQTRAVTLPGAATRMDNNSGVDGTVAVTDGVAEQFEGGAAQVTLVAEKDGKKYANKGVIRSTLTIDRTDPNTGKTAAIKEEERVNEEMQFKKNLPKGDALGVVHTATQVADVARSSRLGYQAVVGSLQDPAGFMRDQTNDLDAMVTEDFLAEDNADRYEAGMPLVALHERRSLDGLLNKFSVKSTYGVAFGVTEDNGGLKPAVLDPKTRQITTMGEVALMPDSIKELERKTGEKLVPGETVLMLHREPALMDGSATNPFRYVGPAKLNAGGDVKSYGIVVNAQDPVGKAMALDFDGDNMVAWVAEEGPAVRGMEPTAPGKPYTAGAKPLALPGGATVAKTDPAVLEQHLARIFTGLDSQIGEVITPARQLREMGLTDSAAYKDASRTAQGVISFQKKPVRIGDLTAAKDALTAERTKARKSRNEKLESSLDGHSPIMSESIDKVVKYTEPRQQQAAAESLIAAWDKALEVRDVVPPVTDLERAYFERFKAAHRHMVEQGFYSLEANYLRKPPLYKHYADRAFTKKYGLKHTWAEIASGKVDNLPEGVQQVADATRALQGLNIDRAKIEGMSEDSKKERAAIDRKRRALKDMLAIQYDMGVISPEAMLQAPLGLTGSNVSAADIKRIYPPGFEQASLRVRDVDGKPLPEGTYTYLGPTSGGHRIEGKDGAERFLEVTNSDNMAAWAADFFPRSKEFKVSHKIPYKLKKPRTEEDKTKGRRESQQMLFTSTALRDPAENAIEDGYQVSGDVGNAHIVDSHGTVQDTTTRLQKQRAAEPRRASFSKKLLAYVDEMAKELKLGDVTLLSTGKGMPQIEALKGLTPKNKDDLRNNRVGGMYVYEDGTHYIMLTQKALGAPDAALMHILGHEMAHAVVQKHGMRGDIREEHLAWSAEWREKLEGLDPDDPKYAQVLADAWNSIARGDEIRKISPETAKELGKGYILFDQEEWVAENVAKWLHTDKAPRSVLDKMFKDIADALKALYEVFRREYAVELKGVPKNVDAWITQIWHSSAAVDLGNDTPPIAEDITQRMREQDVLGDDYEGPPTTDEVPPPTELSEEQQALIDEFLNGSEAAGLPPVNAPGGIPGGPPPPPPTPPSGAPPTPSPTPDSVLRKQIEDLTSVRALDIGSVRGAYNLEGKFLSALVGRKGYLMPDVLTLMGDKLNGTQQDRQMVWLTWFNHVLSPEERAAVMESALSPFHRRVMFEQTGAVDQLIFTDPTHAFLTAMELNHRGDLRLNQKARGILAKLYKALRDVLGVVTRNERSAEILTFLRDGTNDWAALAEKVANPSLRLMAAKNLSNTKLQRSIGAVRSGARRAAEFAREYTVPAYVAAGYHKYTAAREIVENFHAPYESRGVQNTYHEGVSREMHRFASRYATLTEGMDENAKLRLYNHWSRGTTPADADLAAKLLELKGLFKAMHSYARAQGVALGEIKDYVPWQFDVSKMVDNKQSFIDLVVQHAPDEFWTQEVYFNPRTGKRALRPSPDLAGRAVTPEVRRKGAERIHEQIVNSGGDSTQDFNDDRTLHSPYMGAQETRILSFLPQSGVAPFLNDNLDDVVLPYMQQTVKRSEFTHRFGRHGERLDRLKAKARKQGATDRDIRHIDNFIAGTMGTLGRDRPNASRNQTAAQAAITYENFRILGMSGVASIADVAGIYTRSASMKDTYNALKDSFKTSFKGNPTELEHLNDAVGAVSTDMIEDVINGRWGAVGARSAIGKLNTAFFTLNGTRAITRFTRRASLSLANSAIKELVTDTHVPSEFASSGATRAAKEHQRRRADEMHRLGLLEDDVKIGANGEIEMLAQDRRDELRGVMAADIDPADAPAIRKYQSAQAELAKDDRVHTAMMRFVDESSLRPTPPTRPIAANDIHWFKQLAYHLQGFMWQFWETYTRRMVADMRVAIALWGDTPEAKTQVYRAATQLMRMASFGLVYMFAEALRDVIQHLGEDDPNKRGWGFPEWMVYSMLSSGVAGPFEMLNRMAEDVERGNSPTNTLLGPTLQHGWDIVKGEEDMKGLLPAQNVWKGWL